MNIPLANQRNILITGANGFIGKGLVEKLVDLGYFVHVATRKNNSTAEPDKSHVSFEMEDFSSCIDLPSLEKIDTFIHLAGRAHILKEHASDPLKQYRCVNTDLTRYLAIAAAKRGVRRFIFMSSIGVNGKITSTKPFSEETPPQPHNFYAISKWEAEQELMKISQRYGMEIVILRLPLVYGPGVKANFRRLLRNIDLGLPLPFGKINNSRSMLYLGNLVDVIHLCLTHPAAAGKTYLVSDGEDISTPQLIRKLAGYLDRPARLLPIPASLLGFFAQIFGKKEDLDRLTGSLVIDSGAIRRDLGWMPPYSLHEGLRVTADWYRENN